MSRRRTTILALSLWLVAALSALASGLAGSQHPRRTLVKPHSAPRPQTAHGSATQPARRTTPAKSAREPAAAGGRADAQSAAAAFAAAYARYLDHQIPLANPFPRRPWNSYNDITAVNIRFTVRAERLAACSLSSTTFDAGRRAHAANSPNSATDTRSHATPRSPKNDQNKPRSRAYASTVFGERSIAESHDKNSSIVSTSRPSGPTTVHDSTPLDGIHTRRTENPRCIRST
jgi:hypothetical protein